MKPTTDSHFEGQKIYVGSDSFLIQILLQDQSRVLQSFRHEVPVNAVCPDHGLWIHGKTGIGVDGAKWYFGS